MLDKYACLQKLAAHRRDEVVVTTMSVSIPWSKLSSGPLDFAKIDSAMGHGAAFAYGLALAQPNRRVIALNGDGSTLMGLGSLVTIAQRPAPNLTIVITENGTYEVTGSQPVPGAGIIDYAAIARGAGLREVHTIETEAEFDALLPLHFSGPGPAIMIWKIAQGSEPVPKLPASIRDRGRQLRQALVG
jgi:thiamine pyrophosphate-dependent acetolactate synthase large subunit-like protein